MNRRLIHYSLALGILVFAGGAASWLVATRPEPPMGQVIRVLPQVQVMTVKPVRFEAPIVGYGTIRPKRQVQIVPEVSGRIIQANPDLAVGNVIDQGELLFKIDSRIYESKVAQIEAEIDRLTNQLAQHTRRKASLENQLALTKNLEQLARDNVNREEGLLSKKSTSELELEAAKEHQLLAKQSVLTCESELSMIPLQVTETEALLKIKRAQLQEAQLNVEKTSIFCPFDARIDAITAQASQFVTASFQIATLTDMSVLELSVVVDPRELQWADQRTFASATGEDVPNAPDAEVSWTLWGKSFSWKGKVTRLERLDETTRTAHVVVELRDIMEHLRQARTRARLPLSVGMFCQARLPIQSLEDALVIPRYAIQTDHQVYVFVPDPANPDQGRLVLKQVPLLRSVEENILVDFRGRERTGQEMNKNVCELQPGDQIILSPLPKAVEGMRLALRSRDGEPIQQALTGAPSAAPGENADPSARGKASGSGALARLLPAPSGDR